MILHENCFSKNFPTIKFSRKPAVFPRRLFLNYSFVDEVEEDTLYFSLMVMKFIFCCWEIWGMWGRNSYWFDICQILQALRCAISRRYCSRGLALPISRIQGKYLSKNIELTLGAGQKWILASGHPIIPTYTIHSQNPTEQPSVSYMK